MQEEDEARDVLESVVGGDEENLPVSLSWKIDKRRGTCYCEGTNGTVRQEDRSGKGSRDYSIEAVCAPFAPACSRAHRGLSRRRQEEVRGRRAGARSSGGMETRTRKWQTGAVSRRLFLRIKRTGAKEEDGKGDSRIFIIQREGKKR